MAKKMTQRDFYNEILAQYDLTEAHREFIEGRISALDKKSGSAKKPTATQVANEGLKVAIVEGMVAGKEYTITQMIKEIPELADLTNQKVSALISQLRKANLVERREGKGGQALFVLVG